MEPETQSKLPIGSHRVVRAIRDDQLTNPFDLREGLCYAIGDDERVIAPTPEWERTPNAISLFVWLSVEEKHAVPRTKFLGGACYVSYIQAQLPAGLELVFDGRMSFMKRRTKKDKRKITVDHYSLYPTRKDFTKDEYVATVTKFMRENFMVCNLSAGADASRKGDRDEDDEDLVLIDTGYAKSGYDRQVLTVMRCVEDCLQLPHCPDLSPSKEIMYASLHHFLVERGACTFEELLRNPLWSRFACMAVIDAGRTAGCRTQYMLLAEAQGDIEERRGWHIEEDISQASWDAKYPPSEDGSDDITAVTR